MKDFEYVELAGVLDNGRSGLVKQRNIVIYSTLSRGACEMTATGNFMLKYVASGVEVYRYGGKTYPVAEGQFLAVPPGIVGDVEIAHHSGGAGGMCLGLDCFSAPHGEPEAPILFPAECSALGRTIAQAHRRMAHDPHAGAAVAERLATGVGSYFEQLMEEALGHLDALAASRPATRYELLRKLNLARAYLHGIDGRPVALAEVAAAAGISQFHLLRNFRACFGTPPSTYHRHLRLTAAKAAIDRQGASCSEAAHRFGFADGASFSHAYRRAFGVPPTR